ncbi:MAG: hypothetical protein R3B84_22720 [Zavarzinella sp.]
MPTTLVIKLDDRIAKRLQEVADEQNATLSDIALAAITDLLNKIDFEQRVQGKEPSKSFDELAEELGIDVEAFALFDVVMQEISWHTLNAGMDDNPPHLGAAAFCRLLRSRTHHEFGEDSVEILKGWGLHRSEDIGRVVFALVEAGWIDASPDDKRADFDHLFLVEDYFAY